MVNQVNSLFKLLSSSPTPAWGQEFSWPRLWTSPPSRFSFSRLRFQGLLLLLAGPMSGCLEPWTAWSSCPTSWWWRWAEVWPAAPTTSLSARGSSTMSWRSTTDTRSSRRSSATTSSTSTRASRSCWVRDAEVLLVYLEGTQKIKFFFPGHLR